MPKKLSSHSSVTRDSNLIVIGGRISEGSNPEYSSALYELSLKNKQFEWREMNVQLKTPKGDFVASLIPS